MRLVYSVINTFCQDNRERRCNYKQKEDSYCTDDEDDIPEGGRRAGKV